MSHAKPHLAQHLALLFVLLATHLIAACKPFLPAPTATPAPTPTLEPTPILASYYVEQGDGALFKSDWAGAEAAYRQTMQLDSNYALAYSHLAFLYSLQLKPAEETLQMAQKATELAPTDAEAWAYLSLVSAANYRYDQLPAAAEKAVKLDDKSAVAHVALAQARLTLNKVDDAKTELKRALELDSKNVLAWLVQAAYHSSQGEFDQALLSAEKALALQPDFAYARVVLAQAHVDVLEYPEAKKELDAALKTSPDYIPAILALARLHVIQEQPTEAWDVLKRLGDPAPETPPVLLTQGWIYLQRKAFDQAQTRFEKAASLDKTYWPALMQQGQAEYETGKCSTAVETFRHVLDLYPTFGRGHLWLARSLACDGDKTRAQEGYRKALELAPHDPEVALFAGRAQFGTDKDKEALENYRKAMVWRLYDPETYVDLGYSRVNNPLDQAAAESDFQQALALKKDDLWALTGMGRVYNQRKEYDKAIETFTKAQWIYPKSPEIQAGLGIAYTMKGDYKQAIGHLEQAWSLNPKDKTTLLYLARAYREVQNFKKAGWAYDEFLKSDAEVPARSYFKGMSADLKGGQYLYPEYIVLGVMRQSWSQARSELQSRLAMSLVSVSVDKMDEKRTLQLVMQVDDAKFDDEALTWGISAAMGYAMAMSPRIEPAVDGGMRVVLRDAKKQDLVEIKVSSATAQDFIDGLIPDFKTLLARISLRNLRRWESDASFEQALNAIGKNVEKDRNLTSKQQVEFRFITQDEFVARLKKEYNADDQERQAFRDMLVLLGLMKPGAEEAAIEEQASEIAGFYDPKEKAFYIISEEKDMNVTNELTYAHEYAHALQDQYRGLEALDDDKTQTYDQQLAFRAVVEGEASQVTLKYFKTRLTSLEQMTVLQQGDSDGKDEGSGAFLFPYISGLDFLEAVAPDGYWPALDNIYKKLPTSTKQILHPDLYKDDKAALQKVTLPKALSELAGWREQYSNTMGEYFNREYLAGRVSVDLAVTSAAGWNGDRYALYQNEQDKHGMLVAKIAWDSNEEALEFVMAHRLAFGKNADYIETIRELKPGDRILRWEGEGRIVYLKQQGQTTWLVFANRMEDLDTVVPLLKED